MMTRIILAALALFAFTAMAADAAPGTPTLIVNQAGAQVGFEGCGYQAGKQVQLWVYENGVQGLGYIAFIESNGCFGPTDFTYEPPAGSYTVTAQYRHGNKILATTDFTVA